jgi:RluA family pseudouridine synthase
VTQEEEDRGALIRGDLEFMVSESSAGMRLDRVLCQWLPDRSRALIQKHIQQGAITVDGVPPRKGAKTIVTRGSCIVYRPPPPIPLDLVPEEIPLAVLFEDEHLLAINKPANLVVHPSATHRHGTLVHAVLHRLHFAPVKDNLRPGIVHRLDRNTTGVIVIAKNEEAHAKLARAFSERRIEKSLNPLLGAGARGAQALRDRALAPAGSALGLQFVGSGVSGGDS